MTIFNEDFEDGVLTNFTGTRVYDSGAIAATTTAASIHLGSYGCTSSGLLANSYAYAYYTISATTGPIYQRCYVKFTANIGASSEVGLMEISHSGETGRVLLGRNAGGNNFWRIRDSYAPSLIDSGTFTLVTNQWYLIEWEQATTPDYSAPRNLWVDEVQVITDATTHIGFNITEIGVGGVQGISGTPAAGTIYFDDYIADTSYIGPTAEASKKMNLLRKMRRIDSRINFMSSMKPKMIV